jgi:hypothetical protein
MKNDAKFDMLLSEIRELKSDMKEVRQIDLPNVLTRIAVAETNMGSMKTEIAKEAKREARIFASVTGVLAVLSAYFIKH